MKIKVGLYGTNGHQIQHVLQNHPKAELVAVGAFNKEALPVSLLDNKNIKFYCTLEELLCDEDVELVSLCSPRRKDQAADAIKCLEAGKHVYAEKPCAMSEEELDAIIAAVKRTGKQFHEMAGTAFEQPYLEMRHIVKNGMIGEIVQVLAQKSYPYFDGRPQDEDVDGGLTMQVGVHATRFIEHVAGQRIIDIYAMETKLGNPARTGELRMASSMMVKLENGGIASIIANYLNPRGFGKWGNETLRIFGTKGFIEAVDGGTRTRLVIGDKDMGSITEKQNSVNYFDFYVNSLLDGTPMPFTLEEELHPTRMVIRAKKNAVLVP